MPEVAPGPPIPPFIPETRYNRIIPQTITGYERKATGDVWLVMFIALYRRHPHGPDDGYWSASMTVYVNKYDEQHSRATTMVHTDTAQAKVTYRGENGSKFSVLVTQKPNPIGFHARLPGDKRR